MKPATNNTTATTTGKTSPAPSNNKKKVTTLPSTGGRVREPVFPVEPTVVQTIRKIKGTMNHSYRDFSKVPPESDYKTPTEIDQMTFAQKVHHMLSNETYSNSISWMPHGRSFKIHKPAVFEKEVCPLYFGHQRYSSFLRDLNNYGFKHVSRGIDRNCKYHNHASFIRICARAWNVIFASAGGSFLIQLFSFVTCF